MEKIILFAPLIGALIAGFGWKYIGEKAAQVDSDIVSVLGGVPVVGRVPVV